MPQAFLTREYLAISMEYVDGGDMFQYVKVRRGLQVLRPCFLTAIQLSAVIHIILSLCPLC